MNDDLAELRYRQLMASPGGRVLLILMDHHGISPRQAVEPDIAIHIVSGAVYELIPWHAYHDEQVAKAWAFGRQHTDLARELVRQPGIEQWWAPLDRDRQSWVEPESRTDFPTPESFPQLNHPPTREEHYIQWPERAVTTSTLVGDVSTRLAAIINGNSDWGASPMPTRRKRVLVSPAARVCEITSAEDWHDLAVRHGIQSSPGKGYHPDLHNVPWGGHEALVPDWQSVAREWDGVHITTWAFLTATQKRVTSEAGWTELWSRESEETAWLRWVFDEVEDMPPIPPDSRGPGSPGWVISHPPSLHML